MYPYFVGYLDILYVIQLLLSTFVNSSCDTIINIKRVQNSCRNLAVRGLKKRIL